MQTHISIPVMEMQHTRRKSDLADISTLKETKKAKPDAPNKNETDFQRIHAARCNNPQLYNEASRKERLRLPQKQAHIGTHLPSRHLFVLREVPGIFAILWEGIIGAGRHTLYWRAASSHSEALSKLPMYLVSFVLSRQPSLRG